MAESDPRYREINLTVRGSVREAISCLARIPFSSGTRTCHTRGMLTWKWHAEIWSWISVLSAKNFGPMQGKVSL